MKKSRATILVVDDDKNDQRLIETAFERVGVTDFIYCANDGAEAIAYMSGEGTFADREKYPYPAFILTDLKMPGKNGMDVLEFLAANPEWSVVPTIVFSSSSDHDDVRKCYTLGASAYHVKPSNFVELRELLKLIYAYWTRCEVPEVDVTGKQLPTESDGKLGERYPELSSKREKPRRPENK
jgi:CheY-like chemotaxis protein